ncbi:MAG TPA: DNA mismatch repair endonuclease MutL, partial [Planctomycetota bacterium]|nr:DNA mismatch repair endonuclease MutL [Planctomycetota bacterium]
MGVIRKLPQDLVNQIAAGEVIERPASALKELVENALDAGATRIEVALEDGGRRLVRVVDDGCGMSAEDLPLAVASHATSKIAELDDLFRIRTLGFRGEALASIGSISELRVASRPAAGDGHEIEVRGGAASEVRPAGVARGTTIEVRNLFFNTPARRKFLRDAGGELRQCVEALTRVALATPAVAFRISHEGRLCFETQAGASPLERIADLFGRELAGDLVPVRNRRGAVEIGGFVALPRRTRGDSTQQHVSLNGRAIRDKLVASAVRESYQGFLMTRRFPIVFLELTAEPDAVDVNVHPAKLEVRFRDHRDVFALVVRTIRGALEAQRVDPVLAPAAPAAPAATFRPAAAPEPYRYVPPARPAARVSEGERPTYDAPAPDLAPIPEFAPAPDLAAAGALEREPAAVAEATPPPRPAVVEATL